MGDCLYDNLHSAMYWVVNAMNIGYKLWVAVWFVLGMIWAWGLVAIVAVTLEYNRDTGLSYTNSITEKEMPEIINTVDTIPVEVYKLERIEQ